MLNSSLAHSNPIVELDGHHLIDFKQCSEVAEQIDSLVQYSPPSTHDTTRSDVLANVEYSLKSRSGDDTLRVAQESNPCSSTRSGCRLLDSLVTLAEMNNLVVNLLLV
jgi:hypothetical protein